MARKASALFMMALVVAWVLQAAPTSAQLLVVDKEMYVTEVRADKYRIGVSDAPSTKAHGWVKVEGGTQVYRRNGRAVSQSSMWRSLHRGMRIKIHGGGDWDTNVVARKIWY